jgi:serine protease inhibitor
VSTAALGGLNVKAGAPLSMYVFKNAYDAKNADFNDISENGTLYMGKTLQKTCINVDIGGIKAVASSGQEMIMLGIIPTEEKEIILNRPFIYIIADKYNIPLFIGAVTKL